MRPLDAPAYLATFRPQWATPRGWHERPLGDEGILEWTWDASDWVATLPDPARWQHLARRTTPDGQHPHGHRSRGPRTHYIDALLADPSLPAVIRADTGAFTLQLMVHATPPDAVVDRRRQQWAQARAQHLAQPSAVGSMLRWRP